MKRLFLAIIFISNFLQSVSFAQTPQTEEIRDIKPPVSLPADYLIWFLLLAVILGVGIFFLVKFFLKKYRKFKEQPPVKKTPWALAYERLYDLQRQNFLTQKQYKEYYTVLSDIIRFYIEERFFAERPAMIYPQALAATPASFSINGSQKEISTITRLPTKNNAKVKALTTPEFLISLQKSHELNDSQKQLLKEFLAACDIVKFAKHDPGSNEAEKGFMIVKKFVDETKHSEDDFEGLKTKNDF